MDYRYSELHGQRKFCAKCGSIFCGGSCKDLSSKPSPEFKKEMIYERDRTRNEFLILLAGTIHVLQECTETQDFFQVKLSAKLQQCINRLAEAKVNLDVSQDLDEKLKS